MSSKKTAHPNGFDSDKPICFVLMPISDSEGYEKGHFQRVYEDIFEPACEKAGFKAVRADQVTETNLIHLDILQKLIDSPMAICDLSGRNPNALFELGLRQAFDKPVVLVQEVGTPQIFDIAPLRYIEYRPQLLYREALEDQEKIASAISSTEQAFRTGQGINSIVRLLSLTHPAALQKISDDDKQSALLQVIMGELNTIRSDLKSIATRQSLPLEAVKSAAGRVPRARVLSVIRILSADVREVGKEVRKLRNGELPSESPDSVLEDLEGLEARVKEVTQDLRYTDATDEDAESLALLSARIKVLRGQYRKYKALAAQTNQ